MHRLWMICNRNMNIFVVVVWIFFFAMCFIINFFFCYYLFLFFPCLQFKRKKFSNWYIISFFFHFPVLFYVFLSAPYSIIWISIITYLFILFFYETLSESNFSSKSSSRTNTSTFEPLFSSGLFCRTVPPLPFDDDVDVDGGTTATMARSSEK